MPENATPKPGYKTTEFWLSTVATLIGIAYASGAISPEGTGTVEKIVAVAASVLVSLGYTVMRTKAKKDAAE